MADGIDRDRGYRRDVGRPRRGGLRAGGPLYPVDDDDSDTEPQRHHGGRDFRGGERYGNRLGRDGGGRNEREGRFDDPIAGDREARNERRQYDYPIDGGRGVRNDRRGQYDDQMGGDRVGRNDRRGQYDDRMGGDREGRNDRRGQYDGYMGGGRGGPFVGRGRGRGQNNRPRRDKPLVVGFRFLQQLQEREPSDIVMTLSQSGTNLRDCLAECQHKPDQLRLVLNVLAKAFSCNSQPEGLSRILIIVKEKSFFDMAANYFLEMHMEESVHRQEGFKQPINDMIIIMSELMAKSPTAVTQFLGLHNVMQMVIDSLRTTSTVIDDDILTRFRECTTQKENLLKRITRRKQVEQAKENQQDVEGPPDDFRDIEIFPQTADMQANDDRYLRANKRKGRYDDLDHYLDVQFRLLREDFVGPLRDGISNYIEAVHEKGKKSQKIQDVRIYHSVKIISPICGDSALCHVLQFDNSRLGNVRWQSTKRLIYGSLVCLSPDNFKTFYFATVVDREAKDLEKGMVKVRFEHDHRTVRDLFGGLYTMAETTAYFESYRHVLTGLQKIQQGDMPFEKYIIRCEDKVDAPAFLRRKPDTKFDLRPLVDEEIVLKGDARLEHLGEEVAVERNYAFSDASQPAKNVTVLKRDTWPPTDLLHLDESQYAAMHTALTKEFVITQGPPGTGKTYIGLKIVKALLHNRDIWSTHPDTGDKDLRPMLVVCYTNHALDQFLEGIVKYYKGDVLRVGGRSNSEILKEYNLHNFRQRFRHAQKVPVHVFQGRREAKNEMDAVTNEINKICAKIQVASTGILHEDFLKPFIGNNHFQLLQQQFEMLLQVYPEARQCVGRGHSVIVEWLGFGNLAPIVEMEGNMMPAQNVPVPEEDHELIDVEEEIDAIQAQRRVDNDDDDGDSEDEDTLLGMLNEDGELLTRKERNVLIVQRAVNEQMQAVALNVNTMADKPKNSPDGEWQMQKKERRKLKRKAQQNLASTNIMSEEEKARVEDLWRMPVGEKWRLYRSWIKKYCDYLLTEIAEKEDEFDAAAARYREALNQEDKEIMRQSTVIGMTTSGAARYQAVLQEIRPRIIVVEEAAEVLEAHIVTSLSRGCEQLILIGDHKQLRPNPTVFTLAKDYNLDVSLFERMIANGVKWDCLAVQHRMRPQIAELMHHIYENLENHDDVKNFENVKGISTNLYFIDHGYEETHDEDLRSHSNKHEAEYIVALCKYLLLQGYKHEQITVLTMYSGQLFCLRRLMPKDEFEGVRVTVVDNYQGEENDIILLSLVRSNEDGHIGFLKIDNRVCVAMSRAKKGFYAIGNFELLAAKSRLWKEVAIDMKRKGQLGEGLLLYCQNHPDNDGLVAKTAVDFGKAPEGGCDKRCEFRLECGHVCESFCHVQDQEHNGYQCMKVCEKNICRHGHRCKKKCYQRCGDCQTLVPKKIPQCGHTQQVPCYKNPEEFSCQKPCEKKLSCGHQCKAACGNACTTQCTITVTKVWSCGHKGHTLCYQKDVSKCPNPCDATLECEHRCQGTCGICFKGRLHKPCRNDCIRILVCGHECTDRCNQCPPCTRKCENRCVHSKCVKRCGELCAPCMERCAWRCEHFRCTNRCSEPCDRPRCHAPCRKRLTCGHQCIGLCGERCPTDCRICDKEKVTEILFGDEDEPDARFVMLEDCRARCIFEVNAMDRYMDQIDEQGEIKLKCCPKCKTPIRKSIRYGTIINKTLQDIESVKKTVLVNRERITRLEEEIREGLDNIDLTCRVLLRKRLNAMPEPKSEHALVALKNQLEFLRSLRKLQKNWEKLQGLAFMEEQRKGTKVVEEIKEWVLVERSIMTAQESTDAELEISRSHAHLTLLSHQQKLQELGQPIDRNLKLRIREAERILTDNVKYTEDNRLTVETCIAELKKVAPLGVSEAEKVMVVKAMALPSGHWFKCGKGHVYAIGDCGGAVSEGKCPVCKSDIGGTAYRLHAGNQLAPEMDGAVAAAWSDMGNQHLGPNAIYDD